MEQKKIKGTKKTYETQNKKVTKCNRYINLGVNTAFAVDDVVYVLSETEYNDLTATANANATVNISELKETLTEKEKEIAKLTRNITTLETSNTNLTNQIGANETAISELKELIQQKEKELSKYIAIDVDSVTNKLNELETENKDINKEIRTKTDYIVYLEQLQTDYTKLLAYYILYSEKYKSRNIFKRIANTDVDSDIAKPTLKHLDLKGNPTDKETAPTIPIVNKSDANSE